jgi:hypothetical protein
MLSAIDGSISRGDGVTTSSTDSPSVTLCAAVNVVTIAASLATRRPVRTSSRDSSSRPRSAISLDVGSAADAPGARRSSISCPASIAWALSESVTWLPTSRRSA